MLLPIWMGLPEATAINVKLTGTWPARPLTHDLFRQALDQLGVRLARATMLAVREGTVYAQITLTRDGTEVNVDARPSDAVALAVRMGAPIFATAQLVDELGVDAEADA